MNRNKRNVFLNLILSLSALLLLLGCPPHPSKDYILTITSPSSYSAVTNPFYVHGKTYYSYGDERNPQEDTITYAGVFYLYDEITTNATIVSTNKKQAYSEFKQIKAKSNQFDILIDIPKKFPVNAQLSNVSFIFGNNERTYSLDNPYFLTIVFTNE